MKNLEELVKELVGISGELFEKYGTDSYAIRCKIHDIKDKIDNLSELKSNDFESACRPLMKYLCENHNPHMKVIVEGNCAVLLEGEKCFNTNEYILD